MKQLYVLWMIYLVFSQVATGQEVIDGTSPIYNFNLIPDDLEFDFTKLNNSPRYYALVICIEKYQDKGIKDLEYPIQDGTQLIKILETKYGFDATDITFLKNPTRSEILQTLDDFAKKLNPTDNFLLFYAGHGYWDIDTKVGYWLPVDAIKGVESSWLSNRLLLDYIEKLETKHTLLIADACFSGSIFRTRNAFFDAPAAIEQLYQTGSRKALTSGALSEVPDKSVFLEFLTKRLLQFPGKYLSSERLFISMKEEIIARSQNGQIPQYGEIQIEGNNGGDFIFFRKQK